ncbi:Magnesium transporter MRS2-3 [Glycine max]|nr:Magnesium transporter MRS2-3 [Glycine max]
MRYHGRERAIVINLEHIKAIITAQELLLLNSREPSITRFLHELQTRIIRHHNQANVDPNPNPNPIKILPFEFVSLEVCLEAACSVLENEAKTLEQEAHPALDKLTSKISTLNLEHKVKDELEHLLDDDEDMAKMTAPELWFNTILSRDNHGTRNSATYSVVTKQLDVKELEMLLEAYFVQIYGTLNKLSTYLPVVVRIGSKGGGIEKAIIPSN